MELTAVGCVYCPKRLDGSSCKHQAAMANNYGTPSINCIATLSLAPQICSVFAQIALGEAAMTIKLIILSLITLKTYIFIK